MTSAECVSPLCDLCIAGLFVQLMVRTVDALVGRMYPQSLSCVQRVCVGPCGWVFMLCQRVVCCAGVVIVIIDY